MKQILGLIFLFTLVSLNSCQKETLEPQITLVEDAGTVENTISVFGEWLLVDGKMYIENLSTGEKTVYNHFDQNKHVSSLRYDGIMYEFERIVVDSTTWTFIAPPSIPNTGEFWLNNDSIQPYGFYLTTSNMTIVENSSGPQQLGGSSRPLSAYLNGVNNQVNFYVQETYASIDGENVKYFSELTFEKQ